MLEISTGIENFYSDFELLKKEKNIAEWGGLSEKTFKKMRDVYSMLLFY